MLKFVLYFEHYEVISRSVGMTDIVTKEMYDFYDKGDPFTLRRKGQLLSFVLM